MQKINVLLVDDNNSVVEMLAEFFNSSNNINLAFTASDGEEGIKILEENKDKIDLVILDLIMPNKDGLYVLEEMKSRNLNHKVIVSTSYNCDETIRKVASFGTSYFMLKPYKPDDLLKRIVSIFNDEDISNVNLGTNNLQKEISNILHDLGMPSHIKGYQYIRTGITILFEHPETVGGITKELYPELAKKYDTTISRVERAIRHAIEVSWNRGDWDTMVKLFGNSVDVDRSKPTNSEFIVTIADRLRLNYNKVSV